MVVQKLRSKAFFIGIICLLASISATSETNPYYAVKEVNIPDGIKLEVGGITFNNEGQLAVCTRRGEIWVINNPTDPKSEYTLFASGLHEPLGINFKDGAYYVAQRGELTKITDEDNDGVGDEFEAIHIFELSGNYHEYTYGPKFMPNGNMLMTLNLGWEGKGVSKVKWRGWMVEITPEGKLLPYAPGLRSPAGFELNAEGDIFYAENQGDWVGSGRITHLEKGDFAGNPASLKWTDQEDSPTDLKIEDIDDSKGLSLYEMGEEDPRVKSASIWFPHGIMGISTADITVVPEGYGPFAGQMLVGDQGHSKIMRVAEEKVNGVYQGMVMDFAGGFSSGLLRFDWDDSRRLFVGQTARGWYATGGKLFGLEYLEWNGETPFEIKTINATPDGFKINFTKPVSQKSVSNLKSYEISDFTYNYHHNYGSPAIEVQDKKVSSATLSEDKMSVDLVISDLRKGFIYEIKTPAIKSNAGEKLLHDVAYYTLNEIPEGVDHDMSAHDHDKMTTASVEESIYNSPKHPNTMPESWTNGPDTEIVIGTLPGMLYDKTLLRVKAGEKLKLTFSNNDDMLHNLIITTPNSKNIVGKMAGKLGLKGEAKGYIPDSDRVLYFTRILQPEESDDLYFEVPTLKGDYPFVCTFPGHYLVMNGILRVE